MAPVIFKPYIPASTINPDDKCLLTHMPQKIETVNALVYYDETKDMSKFHSMMHDEPHVQRRKKLLDAHPEIRKLLGKDPTSFLLVIGLILVQIYMLGIVKNLSFGWWLAATYIIGSTLNHALFVLMHDLIHFTMFESRDTNLLGAIVTDLVKGLPSAISFGRYHRDHHAYLSVPMIDPDIPAPWEVKMFKYWYTKVLFIIMLPFMYLGRTMYMHPKKISFYEGLNWVVCISFNTFVYRTFGLQSLLYMIVGSLMGLGINPCGTHLLAEHFEYVKGQETFSYYGPINYINLNMGLHVEHHDFPMMPWHRLSKLRKIAPEFYEKIPSHSSYLGVWIRFICDDTMGAPCRISRVNPTPIDTSRLD